MVHAMRSIRTTEPKSTISEGWTRPVVCVYRGTTRMSGRFLLSECSDWSWLPMTVSSDCASCQATPLRMRPNAYQMEEERGLERSRAAQ